MSEGSRASIKVTENESIYELPIIYHLQNLSKSFFAFVDCVARLLFCSFKAKLAVSQADPEFHHFVSFPRVPVQECNGNHL